ncbi:DUF3047 domain-containing protein [Algirhabdus cladophorae]|uniref:DUF3047 domain-containing protein n=1 Tax=Algirhabdus cladophorae TaxID=3377108 RepID=UPI003B8489DB
MIRVLVLALAWALSGVAGSAEQIPFDETWKEQGFLRLFSNEYTLQGARMGVVSDGTISVIWRPIDAKLGQARTASWNWRVDQSVVATDLTKKGGDDRNLAIYFVFVDAETAQKLTRKTARKLLRSPSTRGLVYIWGGAQTRGTAHPSPYNDALSVKILRGVGTGSFSETIDLAADFQRAFGQAPEVLVGVAITADSDDTDGRIAAEISNFQIK